MKATKEKAKVAAILIIVLVISEASLECGNGRPITRLYAYLNSFSSVADT